MRLNNVRLAHGSVAEMTAEFSPGELVVLTGPSGVGKTTLLNTILGIQAPSSGVVEVGSTAFIPQNPRAWLNPKATVAAVLEQTQKAVGHEVSDSYHALLARCRLGPDVLKQRCGHLSGGQSARVALARALAVDSQVLAADEPTAALDVANAAAIARTLVAAADQGSIVIWATHDVDLARAVSAERVTRWVHMAHESFTLLLE